MNLIKESGCNLATNIHFTISFGPQILKVQDVTLTEKSVGSQMTKICLTISFRWTNTYLQVEDVTLSEKSEDVLNGINSLFK